MTIRKLFGEILAICACTILSLACKKPSSDVIPENKITYSIEGFVINTKDLSLINGAKVFTIPATKTVLTDSKGHFVIDSLSSDNYVLVIQQSGYLKYSKSISLTSDTIVSVKLINYSLPFHAGVTFNFWFQPNNASQIKFNMYTKQDFINIKKLGCDVVRLPINLNSMTFGAPNYDIDPSLFSMLDQVVAWAEELHIYLILDNHSYYPNGIPPSLEAVLLRVWEQMAEHYQTRSEYILYETLNEPHDIPDATWGEMQRKIILAIRKYDKNHTIIVDPGGFGSYNNLKHLPNYTDDNLVYDFHFYDPMVFTHQGASFINPPLTSLINVPFPYNSAKMPIFPSNLDGTWFQQQFANYQTEGTVANLKKLIDVAVSFRDSAGVRIFCGEFGAINIAPINDRVFWYQTVRSYLQENNISFTIWDYKDVFGIFKKGSTSQFPEDLDIPMVNALNFDVP